MAQSHLGLPHAGLLAMCDPAMAQLSYIIGGCASCRPCGISCVPFLWPCPPAAVWEFCCLPSPRLDVCAGVFAIFNQNCTVCVQVMKPLEKKALCYLRQFSVFHEHIGNWTPSKSWHILVAVHVPRGTCLIRSWSPDLDKAEEQFEIIPKCKTVSSEMSWWPALFSLKEYPKKTGLNCWKNWGWKNYFRARD